MSKKYTSYSEAIQEIETIIRKIESEELDVDELTIKVSRAIELLKLCREKLFTTEAEVNKLLESLEKGQG